MKKKKPKQLLDDFIDRIEKGGKANQKEFNSIVDAWMVEANNKPKRKGKKPC